MKIAGIAGLLSIAVFAAPAGAFNYPEHREITASAIRGILAEEASRPAVDRLPFSTMLISLHDALAGDGETPLCPAGYFSAPLLAPPSCFDAADLPALSADHSSSPAALYSRWMHFSPATSSTLGNVVPVIHNLDMADRPASSCADLRHAANARLLLSATRAARVALRYPGPDSIDDRLEVADGAYLCLAEFSRPHFRIPNVPPIDAALSSAGNAAAAYAKYHLGALVVARRLDDPLLSADDRAKGVALAMMLEMYALHFLEDGFAAGHIVTPRLVVGDAAARASHDSANLEGLTVRLPAELCSRVDDEVEHGGPGDAVAPGLSFGPDERGPESLRGACNPTRAAEAANLDDRGRRLARLFGDHSFMGIHTARADRIAFNLARIAVIASLEDVIRAIRGGRLPGEVAKLVAHAPLCLPRIHHLSGPGLLSFWDDFLQGRREDPRRSCDATRLAPRDAWTAARFLHAAVAATLAEPDGDEIRPLAALQLLPIQAELRPEVQAFSGLALRVRSGAYAMYHHAGGQAGSWDTAAEIGFGVALVTPPPSGSLYFHFGADLAVTLPTRLSDTRNTAVPGLPAAIIDFGLNWERFHASIGWRALDPVLVFDGAGGAAYHIGMGAEASVGVRAATWNFSALDVDATFRVTGDFHTGDCYPAPGLVARFSTNARRPGVSPGRNTHIDDSSIPPTVALEAE